ncbi:MAG: preprotein translocase subunit SecG [Planctomycetes bacterium]|nr:preprotein translocase subunit SecG [Planctomycetota bacterium]MCB9872098.1 preprotein translocase subunit SecG [Planctomycetota bacterium]
MVLLFWILFFLSSAFLIFIILLQEPKGGGLAEAFGGMGAETFGVKSKGVNRFTLTIAAVWICSAILVHIW